MKTVYDLMSDAMTLKQLSPDTHRAYLQAVRQLITYYNRLPEEITEKEVRDYLLYLMNDKKLCANSCHVVAYAIRFYYREILRKSSVDFYIPVAKCTQHLPDVLTRDEVMLLLSHVKRLKQRIALTTIYSAGLRISEAVNLKVSDIDSQSMVLSIRQAKGNKDRYVPLSKRLLVQLREYWRHEQPTNWLFPTRWTHQKPINAHTLTNAFREALEAAKIHKQVTVHSLRHAFATHLFEAGTDLSYLKQILGHRTMNTTLRYTHISRSRFNRIHLPLDW